MTVGGRAVSCCDLLCSVLPCRRLTCLALTCPAPSCHAVSCRDLPCRVVTCRVLRLSLVLDGAPLIAVHKARYYRRPDGLALGPGPFVAALEYATGCAAEAVGKPEAEFFRSALDGLGCRPEEAVMIGDVS